MKRTAPPTSKDTNFGAKNKRKFMLTTLFSHSKETIFQSADSKFYSTATFVDDWILSRKSLEYVTFIVQKTFLSVIASILGV